EQGRDYVITLKKNQPSLYARVEELFKQAIKQGFSGFTHTAYSTKK
ncbi:MAG: ISAs1 family transposase, partial [Oscillatoriales cyanobacterium]